MRLLHLYRHEARLAGTPTLLAPALLTAVIAGGAVLAAGSLHGSVLAHPLLIAVEMGIPLAAGISTAALLARDPAVELQLSLPARYRATVARRCVLVGAAGGLVAGAVCAGLAATGWWASVPPAHGALIGQLAWVAPMVALVSLGLVAAVALRSPAGATAVVAAPWLIELLLPDQIQAHLWTRLLYLFGTNLGGAADWTANRLTLVGAGLPLAVAGWLLLANTERLLDGEAE